MSRAILIALNLLIAVAVSGQNNSLLTWEAGKIGTVKAGDTIAVKLRIRLQTGHYIYAPTAMNRAQDVQVMKLKFNSSSSWRPYGELRMPTAVLNRSHEVFTGEDNEFIQQFIVSDNIPSGENNIAAQLTYQACNSSICYPPVTEKIAIPFEVSPVRPSATQIIERATARAKAENKKSFIIFHSSWCVWCRKMDTAMQNIACRKFFDSNYVVDHLTVYESGDKAVEENAGAEDLLKAHQPPNSGIPYWLIFDGDGQLVADSQMRAPGAALSSPGKNIGCPTTPEEVKYFIGILRKTSSMSEDELSVIAKVFSAIR